MNRQKQGLEFRPREPSEQILNGVIGPLIGVSLLIPPLIIYMPSRWGFEAAVSASKGLEFRVLRLCD